LFETPKDIFVATFDPEFDQSEPLGAETLVFSRIEIRMVDLAP